MKNVCECHRDRTGSMEIKASQWAVSLLGFLLGFAAFTPAYTNPIGGQVAAGKVLLAAKTAKNVLDRAINMSGIAEAKSATVNNGSIILTGGDQGAVKVSGKLDASGKKAGERSGSVKVLGREQ